MFYLISIFDMYFLMCYRRLPVTSLFLVWETEPEGTFRNLKPLKSMERIEKVNPMSNFNARFLLLNFLVLCF